MPLEKLQNEPKRPKKKLLFGRFWTTFSWDVLDFKRLLLKALDDFSRARPTASHSTYPVRQRAPPTWWEIFLERSLPERPRFGTDLAFRIHCSYLWIGL